MPKGLQKRKRKRVERAEQAKELASAKAAAAAIVDAAAKAAPSESATAPASATTVESTDSFKQNAAFVKLPNRHVSSADGSAVVYLGHIPHGFYEEQMQGFFTQFGKVRRVRLSRNKKTGRSKHFAFIEFESPKVAATVARTMSGYILFGKTLVSHVVPRDKCHPELFKGANRKFRTIPWRVIAKHRHNAPKSAEKQERSQTRLLTRENKKRKKLAALGIEYDFKGYAAVAKQQKKEQ